MLRKLAYALGVWIAALTLSNTADSGDRFSTELVKVDIGAGYLIPRNYIVNIAPDAEDPELVTMRALWPGLEPLTEDNQRFWERRMPERQIHIAILERARDGYRALQGAIEVGALPEAPEPAPFGLMKYEQGLGRRFVPANQADIEPAGRPVVFKCNDETDSVKRNFAFEPVCIVEYPLNDNSGLYYRFFMVNLEHWREIDSEIRKLVNSFEKGRRSQNVRSDDP
jgi:hypothetical protein